MNITETKEGWWIIEGDTHVGKWITDTGTLAHDQFLIPIACNNIKEGAVVIDCGAMYGDHTIAYCKKVGPEGVVIAIEAGADAYLCLVKNAEKFESPVVLVNAVVCQEHGGAALHLVEQTNLGMSQVTEDAAKGVEIRTISIDGLCKDANLGRLDFIKIDVEGYEFEVLKGALGAIKLFKPILLIEINAFTLQTQKATDKDIYDLLLENEYSWRIVQPDCKGGDVQFDILAWPNLITLAKPIII